MSEDLTKQLEGGLLRETLRVAQEGREPGPSADTRETVREQWVADGLDPAEFDRNWEEFAEKGDTDSVDACSSQVPMESVGGAHG